MEAVSTRGRSLRPGLVTRRATTHQTAVTARAAHLILTAQYGPLVMSLSTRDLWLPIGRASGGALLTGCFMFLRRYTFSVALPVDVL